jgi:hypothetical protein
LTSHASLPWLQRSAYFISGPREGVAGSAAENYAARDKAACAHTIPSGQSRNGEKKNTKKKSSPWLPELQ